MILAIDIGGTKTLVALFDEHGSIVQQQRFPTAKDYESFCTELIATIRKDFWRTSIRHIAVAAPGTVDYTQRIITRFGNLPWRDIDIATRLEKAFKVPVELENDANAGALAAVAALATIPPLAVYVTIGTGIGTSVVFNGKLHPIFAHSEGGHMVLHHKGFQQIWESFAAGSAIRSEYGTYAYEITDAAAWQHIAENIGEGLLAIIPMIQPQIVLIGGGIGTHFDKYEKMLKEYLLSLLPSMIPMPEIQKASNPEEAVIYGCYQLAIQPSVAH